MRIKLFAIGITLFAMTGVTACGDDEVDAPSDGMEQKDPSEGDNPDEGSGDEIGDDPESFGPPTILEPLTDYIRPIYTPGKRWIIDNNHGEYGQQTLTMEYTGDTIVSEYPAKIRSTFSADGKRIKRSIVREDADGTEYTLWSNYLDEPKGSSFKVSFTLMPRGNRYYMSKFYRSIVIVGRGTIVLQGVERRALKVWAHGIEPKYDYWVEGIGSLYGYCAMYDDLTVSYGDPSWRYDRILQCYDGDKLIYDYREFRDELYTPIEDYPMIDLRNTKPNR